MRLHDKQQNCALTLLYFITFSWTKSRKKSLENCRSAIAAIESIPTAGNGPDSGCNLAAHRIYTHYVPHVTPVVEFTLLLLLSQGLLSYLNGETGLHFFAYDHLYVYRPLGSDPLQSSEILSS